ncbi:MAG TPA: zeta toxin family protein, partial [Hydrogenophaga sp.]|nr:zeta toxin family protein [Hydrogenophaga sp.]
TLSEASRWANELRADAVSQRKHLVIDTTTPQASLIRELQSQGYEVEVRAIASHRLESELGVDVRFADGVDRNGHGRYVPESVRNDVYQKLPGHLDDIQTKTGVPVQIYDRDGDLHYDSRVTPSLAPGQALEAAREARLTPERLQKLERKLAEQVEWHRTLPERLPNAHVDAPTSANLLAQRSELRVEEGVTQLHQEVQRHRIAATSRDGPNRPTEMKAARDQPPGQRDHVTTARDGPPIRAGTVLKGVGVAGTAYGLYEGYGDFRDAVDGARSTREQHVRGAEAATDMGVRATVSGTSAVVGGVAGGAAGTFVAPGVGTTAGAVVVGGAAAVGAEHAYEDSRVQQWSRALGRELGAISYDHFSKEGRLLRQLDSLREDLGETASAADRVRLQDELDRVGEAFKTEAERNNAYFQGREAIEQAWPAMSQRFDGLDKGDVVDAYQARLDAGMAASRAVTAAYSDTVHEQVQPRGLPHVPQADYGAYNDRALASAWQRFSREAEQGGRQIETLERRGPEEASVPLVGGLIGRHYHDTTLEKLRNAQWEAEGHRSTIEGELRERGLGIPQIPATRPPKEQTMERQRDQSGIETPATRQSASIEVPGRTHSGLSTDAKEDQGLSPASRQLLADSEREVAQVARQHGLKWDQGLSNTCCAVASAARQAGMTQVNLFRADAGVIRFGQYDGYTIREGEIDAVAAANTPQTDSLQRLAAVDRQTQQDETREQQQVAAMARAEPEEQRARVM